MTSRETEVKKEPDAVTALHSLCSDDYWESLRKESGQQFLDRLGREAYERSVRDALNDSKQNLKKN